jgi:hypothetical protein
MYFCYILKLHLHSKINIIIATLCLFSFFIYFETNLEKKNILPQGLNLGPLSLKANTLSTRP